MEKIRTVYRIKLTGGNAEKLNARTRKNPVPTNQIQESIKTTQMWNSAKDVKAIRMLNIYALSVLKTIAAHRTSDNRLYLLNKPKQEEQLGKKVFVKLFLNTKRAKKLYLLLDSGSDISLIHVKAIRQLLTPQEIEAYKSENTHQVETFSNDQVNILYNITLPWGPRKHGPSIPLTFSVYDQKVTHTLLLGQDAMQKLQMMLSFAGKQLGNKPVVNIFVPERASLECKYDYPSELSKCSTYLMLKPNETTSAVFTPSDLANLRPHQTYLISESDNPEIFITPSVSSAYSKPDVPLVAYLTNLSNKPFEGLINAEIEEITEDNVLTSHEEKTTATVTDVQYEVINSISSLGNVPTIKLKESLPETETAVIPLSAYLIKTPFETKHFSGTNPENAEGSSDPEGPTLAKETAHLQTLEFDSLEPSEPEVKQDIPEELKMPQGFEIPCTLPKTVEELLKLEQHEILHQTYLKRIFVDKYPTVVATHAYDIGDISKTLGYYKIELKDNTPLPAFKKLYYLAPQQRQQMQDILDYLLKYEIIERACQNTQVTHLFASPAYLVEKKDPESPARFIINYQILNQAIKTAPPVIPNITHTLQNLRDMYMYSTTDLKQAYFSCSLHEESRSLTRFVTDFGSYQMKRLAMGLSTSPSSWAELTYRMVHMKPVLDDHGDLIYTDENVVKLDHDPIYGCEIFYDDLIFATELKATYEETVQTHYALVEKVIERLAFHRAKLSLDKSLWGRTHIKFLGWYISHNTLFPDKKRVDKLLGTQFPTNIHAMRSWTGLLQTIRTTLPCSFMKEVAMLTPLCSSTKPYNPSVQQKDAFQRIKTALTEMPIFSRIIDPWAKKLIFVDSSEAGCYAAVLCQIERRSAAKHHIPDSLSLSDPVDRIIYDNRLCYDSVPLYTLAEHVPRSQLPTQYSEPVKNIDYLEEDYLGYSADQVSDSLFIAVRSIQYAYGCQLSNTQELRRQIIAKLKPNILYHRLLESQFNNDKEKFQTFLSNFQNGNGPVDDRLYLVEILALVLNRPITVISTLPQHNGNHILQFVNDSQKPPFVLGAYYKNNYIIFRPYFIDRNSAFNLKEIANTFHIVAFWSKAISEKDAKLPIAEKELFAILGALDNFSKLIGHSDILCLTDSKALFLLFSNPVSKSISKLSRWGLKLHLTYPQLRFRFIRSRDNLSDFLTRNYNAKKLDLKRLQIKNFEVSNLDNYIDPQKEFSLNEWKDFVDQHQHLLTYQEPVQAMTVQSISKAVKNIHKLLEPTDALKDKMSHQSIASHQLEFVELYNDCIAAPNFTIGTGEDLIKLSNGLLYKKDKGVFKILLPEALEGLFISYHHLAYGHAGPAKLSAMLFAYYFPKKLQKIKRLCAQCFSCALTNPSTQRHVLGSYPIPSYMYETCVADLAESLPPSQGYSHFLLLCCPLTHFIHCYPLKDKTAAAVAFHVQYGIFQNFRVKNFLSDNGKCFTEKHFLSLLDSLNIQRIQIASLHPRANGKAESTIKTVKYLLKKTLASNPDYRWTDVLPLLIKQLNSTVHPETGFSPLELLHGKHSPSSESPFHQAPPDKLYPLLQNFKTLVDAKRQETKQITEFLRQEIQLRKVEIQQYLNKNRITTTFNVGDYCFIKDRSITVGVNPSLRTFYDPNPHIILQDRPTTVVVRRLADSFQSVYSKDDVKKYNRLDATFLHLPLPVRKVLINSFETLHKLDFVTIQKHSTLPLPQSLILDHQDDSDNEDAIPEDYKAPLPSLIEDPAKTTQDNNQTDSIDEVDLPIPNTKTSISLEKNQSASPQHHQKSTSPINLTDSLSTLVPQEPTQNVKQTIPINLPNDSAPRSPRRKHARHTRANPINSESESSEDENPAAKQVSFAPNKVDR